MRKWHWYYRKRKQQKNKKRMYDSKTRSWIYSISYLKQVSLTFICLTRTSGKWMQNFSAIRKLLRGPSFRKPYFLKKYQYWVFCMERCFVGSSFRIYMVFKKRSNLNRLIAKKFYSTAVFSGKFLNFFIVFLKTWFSIRKNEITPSWFKI